MNNFKFLKIAPLCILVTAILTVTVFMLYAGSSSISLSITEILMILWTWAPFLLAYIFTVLNSRRMVIQKLFMAVSLLNLGCCVFTFYDAMFVHIDAQGALVFIFVPLYLNAELLVLGILNFIVTRFLKVDQSK